MPTWCAGSATPTDGWIAPGPPTPNSPSWPPTSPGCSGTGPGSRAPGDEDDKSPVTGDRHAGLCGSRRLQCPRLPDPGGLPSPKIGEREATAGRLAADSAHHLVRRGDVLLGDKGFAGAEFEAFLRKGLGAQLVRPDRKEEPARFGKLARVRQWIESVIDTAKGQLTLEQHGGRILAGVYARVAARLLALAAAIWHNWQIGAPIKRSLIAYDH